MASVSRRERLGGGMIKDAGAASGGFSQGGRGYAVCRPCSLLNVPRRLEVGGEKERRVVVAVKLLSSSFLPQPRSSAFRPAQSAPAKSDTPYTHLGRQEAPELPASTPSALTCPPPQLPRRRPQRVHSYAPLHSPQAAGNALI